MQDTKVIPLNNHYRYSLYANQKAIVEFILSAGHQPGVLKGNGVLLLIFLVNSYMTMTKGHYLNHEGKRYLKITTSFIRKNLPSLGLSKSSINDVMNNLEKYGVFQKIIYNRMRFIRINERLLELWGNEDYSMTAIAYLNKYHTKFWERFKNEWQPILGNSEFEKFVHWYNEEAETRQMSFNDTDALLRFMYNSIKRWKNTMTPQSKSSKK